LKIFHEAVTSAGGYESLSVPDVEADDVIATVVRYFDCSDNTIILVSDDKDMFQLLSDNVVIKHSKRGNFDRIKFVADFQFAPPLFADYLALAGDDTDNIPGADGIGEGYAKQLVRDFGGVEEIYAKIAQVPKKLQGKLVAGRESVLMSKKLTVLKKIDLDVNWIVF
jgi:DNA polymerase-1